MSQRFAVHIPRMIFDRSCDTYPTLCELAELPVPPHCEGKSLQPVLDHPDTIHQNAVFTSFGDAYAVETLDYLYTEWGGN